MKNITVDLFDAYEFIPTLLKYFALGPDRRVTCPGAIAGSTLTYYQDDNGIFHKVSKLPGLDEEDFAIGSIRLETLVAIISYLNDLPATMPECEFKNMREQVRLVATAYIDPRRGY